MASGVACQHRPSTGHTVERRRAWNAINAFGQYTWSDDVGRGMPSSTLGSTHGRMTSGVACHHYPWTAHTVGRRRAWHDFTALGLHAWLDYVGRGMTSPLLDSTHGRQHREWHDITALRKHTWSDYVGRGMTSPLLDSTHGQTTSGMA